MRPTLPAIRAAAELLPWRDGPITGARVWIDFLSPNDARLWGSRMGIKIDGVGWIQFIDTVAEVYMTSDWRDRGAVNLHARWPRYGSLVPAEVIAQHYAAGRAERHALCDAFTTATGPEQREKARWAIEMWDIAHPRSLGW